MIHVALFEPQIPPNTGNIVRLVAATRCCLHLIGRLGFRLDDKSLKRAGLDYWEYAVCHRHDTWQAFHHALAGTRIWTVDNPAPRTCYQVNFQDGDVILFGSETTGLPTSLHHASSDYAIEIPMISDKVRSLNLANSVAIVLYEALRQVKAW